MAVTKVYLSCGEYYIGVAKYVEAIVALNKDIQILSKYDISTSVYTDCVHQLARVYAFKGDYDAALTMHEESLKIRKSIYGINNSCCW